jgi:hypothetical protein
LEEAMDLSRDRQILEIEYLCPWRIFKWSGDWISHVVRLWQKHLFHIHEIMSFNEKKDCFRKWKKKSNIVWK